MKFKNLLRYFFLLHSAYVFCGVAPETFMTASNGGVCAKDLKAGDSICGFDPEQVIYPNVSVEKVDRVAVDCVYVISTERGAITVSANKLFYEVVSERFVCASELMIGDLFLTKDLEILVCDSVDQISTQMQVCDITLAEPHLFWGSEAQILMHNAVPVLVLGIPAATTALKVVASAALVAAVLYSSKIAKAVRSIFSVFGGKRKYQEAHSNQRQDEISTRFMNQNEGQSEQATSEK